MRSITRTMVGGPPVLDADQPTADLVTGISQGDVVLPGLDGLITDTPLEALRAATDHVDTATSGLVVILELHRRAKARSDPGWLLATAVRSAWQPSLATVLDGLSAHLAEGPSVADSLWWITHRFVVSVHERIAYSKLPEHTFRFRWEDGRVRFFDNGIGRFPLAAIRKESLAFLTHDLGLWDRDHDVVTLTPGGQAFIVEALP